MRQIWCAARRAAALRIGGGRGVEGRTGGNALPLASPSDASAAAFAAAFAAALFAFFLSFFFRLRSLVRDEATLLVSSSVSVSAPRTVSLSLSSMAAACSASSASEADDRGSSGHVAL